MAKKKNLPNHNIPAFTQHDDFFSGKQIEELRSCFNFYNDFPLQEKLEEAVFIYKLLSSSVAPAAEQKLLLNELIKHSDGMIDILSRLGLQETATIAYNLSQSYAKDDLISKLRSYRAAAHKVLKKLPTGGRPPKVARKIFLKELHIIYQEGTGDNRKYTFSSAEDSNSKYIDPFSQFTRRIFEFIDEYIDPNTLGRAVAKALSITDKTPR